MINSEYILFGGVLALILIDLLRLHLKINDRKIIHFITLAILIAAFIAEIIFGDMNITFFSATQYSQFVNGFILFLAV